MATSTRVIAAGSVPAPARMTAFAAPTSDALAPAVVTALPAATVAASPAA